jgi:hypothetical protein
MTIDFKQIGRDIGHMATRVVSSYDRVPPNQQLEIIEGMLEVIEQSLGDCSTCDNRLVELRDYLVFAKDFLAEWQVCAGIRPPAPRMAKVGYSKILLILDDHLLRTAERDLEQLRSTHGGAPEGPVSSPATLHPRRPDRDSRGDG